MARAWGANAVGQLGDGSFAPTSPHAVSGISSITGMHGGRQHVIALRADGSVWCWGHGLNGQLGIGSTANRNVPTKVHNLANVKQVRTGHYHSLALRNDGTVWAWGLNKYGQLGDGTTRNRSLPVRVKGLGTAIAIAGARDHSLAILKNGTVWAWGLNQYGNLGTGNTVSHHLPVQVKGLTQMIAIAGGRDHTLAIRKGGAVYAWGWNAYGQIGDGTTVNRHLAKRVALLPGSPRRSPPAPTTAWCAERTARSGRSARTATADRRRHRHPAQAPYPGGRRSGLDRHRPPAYARGEDRRLDLGLGSELVRPARRRLDPGPPRAGAGRLDHQRLPRGRGRGLQRCPDRLTGNVPAGARGRVNGTAPTGTSPSIDDDLQ